MHMPVWAAAYIYYYDVRKDDLILDAVRPLLGRLAGHVERAYFVRHWRQGPHLRIPMLVSPAAFREQVEPAVTDVIGRYLAQWPSTKALLPEEKLLPMHQRLAEMEQDLLPLRPLVPDNTIVFVANERQLQGLDGEVGANLLAQFYAETTELAFQMLEAIRRGSSPVALSLSLMLAVAHAFPGENATLASGFVSFRSHAEAFLHRVSDPPRVRADFDRQYQANKRLLTRLVLGVLDTLDRGTGEIPFVSEWVAAVRPVWGRARGLLRSGELSMVSGTPMGNDGSASNSFDSPMHQLMAHSPTFRRYFYEDVQFQCYRVALNYTYLHLARLGVMGYERFRLCHLAANAVEDSLGVNALDMVVRVAQS